MRILIASHGNYALGLRDAAYKLSGSRISIDAIACYIDDTPIQELFDSYLKGSEEKWVILTDMLGGSVNQYAIQNCCSEQFHVISGVNLFILLRVLEIKDDSDLDTQINEIILENHSQNAYVNELLTDRRDHWKE